MTSPTSFTRRLLGAFVMSLLPAVAAAELDTLDDVPGSVLILPYFEVDLDDPNGPDTVFSVHNSSPVPIIAAVGLATDWGVSTLSFAVFLQAYDAQEIRLRDVFRGYFPNVQPPPAFCPALGPIGSEEIDAAIAAHRGDSSGDFCSGQDFGDDLLRGSVFVISPGSFVCDARAASAGIFESGDNALWGDYYLIDRGAKFAAGELLVSLEANTSPAGVAPQGVVGNELQDFVPPAWAARYVATNQESTDLIAFRFVSTFGAQACETEPPWFPLTQQELFVIDEDGDAIELTSFRPFPLAANRVRVDSIDLPLPPNFSAGWIYVDFGDAAALTNGTSPASTLTTLSALRRSDDGASLVRGINFLGSN